MLDLLDFLHEPFAHLELDGKKFMQKPCLLYHLNNSIVSFGAQSAYFAKDQDAFRASQQLVAAWDGDEVIG